ncbi:MAG: prolipoprotein diacylglyceryl transferase [Prevotellaceae bacterium]|jgi:prolipoprotein diacylglyceryl transferase|nr:prolipoprotein diacylglyceryl transferase [Prevotellaceae bacterium]
MLSSILAVTWNPDPVIFSLGALSVRWYGLLYASGFLIAIKLLEKMFKHERAPENWIEKVFIYIVLAVIVGARLGHVFFYAWDYYSVHPVEIFKIWEGGLASHGGTIAMLIVAWLLSHFMIKQNMFWLGDRLFVPSALMACMIRLGNLMNSEIYGTPTNAPWGFIFVRGGEKFFDVQGNLLPCHPTQLYEGGAYLLLFALLWILYWRYNAGKYNGLLAGIGFVWVFTARFLIEFIKNDQEAFEAGMIINMGQWLSIPFILLGIGLIVRALKKGAVEYHLPQPSGKPTPKGK